MVLDSWGHSLVPSVSVQWGDGAANGGCGIEGRVREGARSSIAAGPGFSALLNPEGHFTAVSAGAHAAPRGGTDTLRAARRPRGRSGASTCSSDAPSLGREKSQANPSPALPAPPPSLVCGGVKLEAAAAADSRLRLYADASASPDSGFLGHRSGLGARVPASSVCERSLPRGRQRGAADNPLSPYPRFCVAFCEAHPRDPLVLFTVKRLRSLGGS